jgi:hypothetical protein
MRRDEVIAKAIEWLRQKRPKMRDQIRDVTPNQLPQRRVTDAAVIHFSSDDNTGGIVVVMDRRTGAIMGSSYHPPKPRRKPRKRHD